MLPIFDPTNPLFAVFILIVTLWTIPWKGVALWRAARNKHLVWFIVLLLVNTLAILEIIYIFAFSKPKIKQTKSKTKPRKKRK